MTKAERLAAVWAKVPDVACRGLCQPSCGPIAPARIERRAAERAAGRRLAAPMGRCSLLGHDGRCTAYAARPLICRLYGATEGLRCPWGCRPARLLTDEEALDLMAEVCAIEGEDGSEIALRSGRAVRAAEEILDVLRRPEARHRP